MHIKYQNNPSMVFTKCNEADEQTDIQMHACMHAYTYICTYYKLYECKSR